MAQAASFFSAGFDTSAVPIAFTLYELALQPEIQNTLRKEILEAFNEYDGKLTYDMVHKYHTPLRFRQISVTSATQILLIYFCETKYFSEFFF